MKRVVVTGLGAVTPLGHNVEVFWQRLVAGKRGIARITKFNPTGLRNDKAGQIWDWAYQPDEFPLGGVPDEATQFLLYAAREALADAGLVLDASPDPCAGAIMSTNFGGSTSLGTGPSLPGLWPWRTCKPAFNCLCVRHSGDRLCVRFDPRRECRCNAGRWT